ncbi:fused MFS/spermidine synthase [Acinetobacter proteolyticus]|uniref:fused MFS/spermidine synthase n=1 Tax=Acinetobacter proteolyticus TaxID=1776741 RepID=UPI003D95BB2C
MNFLDNKILSNLTGIFFISGFSALVYQVCWQRLLFTGFGVDLTSITVIVSVFMLGLGIGAFYGGRIADKFNSKIIIIFSLTELLIGFFGLLSRKLILIIQDFFVYSDLLQVAFVNFMLLLFPTFLMGSTLPLLTSFFNKYMDNIGEAIGTLYFFNTLGAAFGALTTGFILFNYVGVSYVIFFASTLNIIISIFVFVKYRKYSE